jgi:hypothetical protein
MSFITCVEDGSVLFYVSDFCNNNSQNLALSIQRLINAKALIMNIFLLLHRIEITSNGSSVISLYLILF